MQIRAIVTLTLTFEAKITVPRHSVENYYCAKFQVIPISFHFIVLTYLPHKHTS